LAALRTLNLIQFFPNDADIRYRKMKGFFSQVAALLSKRQSSIDPAAHI
jgi:hypothetical protein